MATTNNDSRFEYVKKLYYRNIFEINALEENIQMIFCSALAFFVPFMLKHPQMLVGTIVNASLILGATYLKGYKLLPVIMLPSLGVLAAGLIFGPFTIFLIYMIPFIWIGNAIFAYSYKALYLKLKSHYLSIPLSALMKSLFLFSAALMLVSVGLLPSLFLSVMGVFQLYTAVLGGTAAWGIIKLRNVLLA